MACFVSCGIDLSRECTITYIGNGATSGTVESQVVKTHAYAKLNPNEFKIGEKQALGWSTDPAGRFYWIPDGASLYITEDVTLYAYWGDAQPFTIRFEDKAGQINLSNNDITTKLYYTLNGSELTEV